MTDPAPQNISREDMMSAMFASMVIQNTKMALMFMGKAPNEETGEHVTDLDTAKLFIDQLEMLEIKTKGNLDKREEQLLKQSLMTLRMAFVEAVNESSGRQSERKEAQPASPSRENQGTDQPAGTAETDSRKKFTKKY